jgi:hypothetical protein
MTARLKQMYPATRIERVDPSEIPALYEVVMGQNVAYTDASGRYFVFGHLFDMQTQRDLTAERLEKQQRVAFSELPFADAIKTVRGNGERVLAVFSDPDCPYCQRLESELEKLDNLTLYTFAYPLESLHPEAKDKAVSVWCAPDRARAWAELMKTARHRPSVPAIIRSIATSHSPNGWGYRARPRCCPPTGAFCRVPRAASGSSNGWRRAGHEPGRGLRSVHARARSPGIARRMRWHDVRARRAREILVQGAGRDCVCFTRRGLRQRAAEQSAGPRAAGRNSHDAKGREPWPYAPVDHHASRAQLGRANPQRPDSATDMAGALGGRRGSAARPVVRLLRRRSRPLAACTHATQRQ